jgi:hypothetical protein
MTDTRAWKKITGRQSDWDARGEYDDGSIEELACVHDRFWREVPVVSVRRRRSAVS